MPVKKPKYINYRSYKQFNTGLFVQDMPVTPFQVAQIFGNVGDPYWVCNKLMKGVIDEHALLKQRGTGQSDALYNMNSDRKAINIWKMLSRIFNRLSRHGILEEM